jgi:hypothetical protein
MHAVALRSLLRNKLTIHVEAPHKPTTLLLDPKQIKKEEAEPCRLSLASVTFLQSRSLTFFYQCPIYPSTKSASS